ncbi:MULTISPECIES: GrpB family protein [Amycolatopsis]|uniref:GrpB family protein n=1 Tax=Amycolatopsis albidoflavus TaxID=102226 RepID=A0ABW5HU62_9PSEU
MDIPVGMVDSRNVSSTSAAPRSPGLAAKPIIDLTVVIASREDLAAVVAGLRAIGYRHEDDLGIPGREAFARHPGTTTAPHLRLRSRQRESRTGAGVPGFPARLTRTWF